MQRQNEEFGGWFWTNLRIYAPFRLLAVLVVAALGVVGCGQQGAISRNLEALHWVLPTKADGKHKGTLPPAEKLLVASRALAPLLMEQQHADLGRVKAARARRLRAALQQEFNALHRQFSADRAKLGSLDADAAVRRLEGIQRATVGHERRLSVALTGVALDGTKSARSTEAARQLNSLFPEREQQPLSSDLSFRTRSGVRAPATLSAGIVPAYSAPIAGAAAASLPRDPAPQDTASGAETAVTPAIHKVVLDNGGDPVKLFNFVRNTIKYEPYLGIRKGADATLIQRAGSDADQAALLIALLHDAGVPARFVRGVGELPAAQAANWLGIDVAAGQRVEAAPEILASGGIPTTQVRVNGALSKVRFDHYWLEAYVPDSAYRGVNENAGSQRWLALDPSVKRLTMTPPRVDPAEVAPDVKAWQEQFVTSGHFVGEQDGFVGPAMAANDASVGALIDKLKPLMSSRLTGRSIATAAATTAITPTSAPYLPASMPFVVKNVVSEGRSVAAASQAQVTISIAGSDAAKLPAYDEEATNDDGFSFSAPTAELATKRITVSYAPATAEDQAVIDAYHGMISTPAYGASLIPVLRVDGAVVARGTKPVPIGYLQNFRITYRSPGFAPETVENPIEVGALQAVALDVGHTSKSEIDARVAHMKAQASTATYDNMLTDARAGELLALGGDIYFRQNDENNRFWAAAMGVSATRAVSGAILGTGLRTATVAGFPVRIDLGGANVDVDQDVQAVVPLTDDTGLTSRYLQTSGTGASFAESQTLKYLFVDKTVSTGEVIAKAAGEQIPIYQIRADNVDRVAPQLDLDAAVVRQIRAAVQGGAEVTVPKSNVTIGGWIGSAYVVSEGGALDYRIAGGSSGGTWNVDGVIIDIDINIPTSLPGNILDPLDWLVWYGEILGLNRYMDLACISTALTAYGLVTEGSVLPGMAAFTESIGIWLAATVTVVPVGFFVLLAQVMLAIMYSYFLYKTYDEAGKCLFNGLGPTEGEGGEA